MATVAPDPKTFGSWEEAFKYPVATVRGIERQLRGEIDLNREKLRTLVGKSYRDLLGTAESIIEMDGKMQETETHLEQMSKMCSARLLEKKMLNLRSWDEAIGATGHERFAFASQLAVLRSCPDLLAKILRKGESLLLAAKVLVISRLLHKKLSQRQQAPQYLEGIRLRLAGFRRKLLARVDKVFKCLEVTRDVLIEAMCAFSLATSSSPTNILKHFHHIRLDTMITHTQKTADVQQAMSRALQIYVTTIKETREYFPRQLAYALQSLKSTPVIDSQELHIAVELNLELYGQLISDDIKNFVPYIRHDELQRPETDRILKNWAEQAFSSFLNALKTGLQPIGDPITAIHLRKDVLQLWMSTPQQNLATDPLEALEGLRDVFNAHSIQLIRSQIMSLGKISATVETATLDWGNNGAYSCQSLWDISTISAVISKGENPFRGLLASAKGETEALRRVSQVYKAWYQSAIRIEEMIKSMKETKWEVVLNDIENEDLFELNQGVLSEDDPSVLQKELEVSLEMSFANLESLLQKQVAKSVELHDSQKSIYLLRVWREIRQHLPNSYRNFNVGIESISILQVFLGEMTIEAPLVSCKKRISNAQQIGQNLWSLLWEGDRKLPILPSSWVFRLLHDIVSSMSSIGIDVWTDTAVNLLKKQLRIGLASYLKASRPSAPMRLQANETMGDSDESSTTLEAGSDVIDQSVINDQSQVLGNSHYDGNIQLFFDIIFLILATTRKGESVDREADGLIQLKNIVEDELDLEQSYKNRIRRDAEDYWRRTSVFFALLM